MARHCLKASTLPKVQRPIVSENFIQEIPVNNETPVNQKANKRIVAPLKLKLLAIPSPNVSPRTPPAPDGKPLLAKCKLAKPELVIIVSNNPKPRASQILRVHDSNDLRRLYKIMAARKMRKGKMKAERPTKK